MWRGFIICTLHQLNGDEMKPHQVKKYKIQDRNAERRRLHERPRSRWEDKFITDLKYVKLRGFGRIKMAQDSV